MDRRAPIRGGSTGARLAVDTRSPARTRCSTARRVRVGAVGVYNAEAAPLRRRFRLTWGLPSCIFTELRRGTPRPHPNHCYVGFPLDLPRIVVNFRTHRPAH